MRLLKLTPAVVAYSLLQVALRRDDDAELVRRLKARQHKALADLYARCGRLAYSVILRIVHDAEVAEDLTQETFLRVWNRVEALDAERGALTPWVLTVARNRAIDHLHAADEHVRSIDGRLDASSPILERLERPGLFTGLDASALTIGRARRLQKALDKLSANQRAVIELAYYEGMSLTQMAERLNQPIGVIKTWTRTALQILRAEPTEAAIA
jgi:RNA polymerase sigma-70 factor, ECF subfamily